MRGTKKAKVFKTLIVPLVMVWLLFFAFPRDVLATRSYAGGGELAKFSFSDFALTVGISLASYGIGSTLSSALSGSSLASSFNSAIELSNVIQGYNTYVATSQVSRAVGMAGSYHEWDPRWTFAASTMATGATAGYLNPELALGKEIGPGIDPGIDQVNPISPSSMWKGASVGALGGAAQGLTIALIDGERIDDGKKLSVGGQVYGMVAGTMATNLGRELVNPSFRRVGFIEIERETVKKVDAEGRHITEEYYKPIEGVNWKGVRQKGVRQYGERIPASEFKERYKVGDGYKFEPRGQDVFEIIDTRSFQRGLFKPLFIDTFSRRQWPILATRAVGIWAADSIKDEDKEYLKPLYRTVAESVSQPIFSGWAEIYGLGLDMFVGSKNDLIESRIQYASAIKEMGFNDCATKINKEILKAKNEFIKRKMTQKTFNDYVSKLNDIAKEKGLGEISLFTYEEAETMLDMEPREQLERIGEKLGQVAPSYPEGPTAEQFRYFAEEETPKEITKLEQIAEINTNLAIVRTGGALEAQMKEAATISDALKIARTNRWTLRKKQFTQSLKFGLFNSVISGGLQYVAAKNLDLEEDSPAKQLLLTYAYNMGTAILRGVAWRIGWEEAGTAWHRKWDFAEPKPYDKKPGEEGFDIVEYKLSQTTYPKEMQRYKRFIEVTGIEPKYHEERTRWDFKEGKWVKVPDPRWVATINFPDKRPSLAAAIGTSILQANTEYLANTFSFGYPTVKPENVSALRFVDYTNYLSSISSMSGKGAHLPIVYGARNANVGATANNLLGMAAQSNLLTDAFYIQQERFVKTEDAFKVPYTIQRLRYIGGLVTTESIFWAPYPNVHYGIRPQTGVDIFLRTKGLPK